MNIAANSVAARLAAGYAAVILLLGFTWAAGAYSLGQLNGRITHIVAVDDALLSNINTRVKLLDDEETGLRGYLLTARSSFLSPYTAARRQLPDVRRDGIILVGSLPEARPQFHVMRVRARAWETWAQQTLQGSITDTQSPGAIANQIVGKGLFDRFRAASTALTKKIEADRAGDLAEGKQIELWLNILSAVIVVVALVATIVIGWLTMRTILRPLGALCRVADAIGRGELEQAAEVKGAHEFTDLARSMDQMRLQLARANAALKHRALHDSLTGLPNRVLLHDRLEQAIRTARRGAASMALFIMDLDGFKEVNDTLGHDAGDALLQEVARRLQGALRESDTVARLGGDEFAVVLPAIDAERAEHMAQKIQDALSKPLMLAGHRATIGASIGIVLYPSHGDDAATLLRHADIAMYAAKRGDALYATYSGDQEGTGQPSLALLPGSRRRRRRPAS